MTRRQASHRTVRRRDTLWTSRRHRLAGSPRIHERIAIPLDQFSLRDKRTET